MLLRIDRATNKELRHGNPGDNGRQVSADEKTPLTELLSPASVVLQSSALSRDDAIAQAGAGLLAVGAVASSYIDAMVARENSFSTFMGDGVAIPHATLSAGDSVRFDALSMVRFPDGVDWDGHDVRIVFGIAAVGRGHIALLSQLASVLIDPVRVAALRAAVTVEQVHEVLDLNRSARRVMTEKTVIIASAVGLHARPASLFAQAAAKVGVHVTLTSAAGKSVNAASILGVLSLGINHGETVTLTAEGDGSADALELLAELLSTDFDRE